MHRSSVVLACLIGLLLCHQVAGHDVKNLRRVSRIETQQAHIHPQGEALSQVNSTLNVEALAAERRGAEGEEEEEEKEPPYHDACRLCLLIMVFLCCCGTCLDFFLPGLGAVVVTLSTMVVIIWLFYTGSMLNLFTGAEMSIWCKISAIWALIQIVLSCMCCAWIFIVAKMIYGAASGHKK
eukprot:gnl/TRDRNA2_/TRDRNA2_171337_c5_seq2.p1 gnl/TRDRNA2_/TRDRNA2_171337_c5~~gnl/TRDRNA2_/TRDRNA2_171337_c5_seq2.p1  ORF type:complete len:181 (-),score=15.91 gnl/TRDRNA2_/TRDRNA2_171337_c5_seq2:75-617(-)